MNPEEIVELLGLLADLRKDRKTLLRENGRLRDELAAAKAEAAPAKPARTRPRAAAKGVTGSPR